MTTEERLEKLEIGLVRAKLNNNILLGLVLLAFVLLAVTMTGVIPIREDVVNAKQFNLLDDKGKTRAILSADEDEPRLVLYDVDGTVRAGLSALKDGSRLVMYDADGKTRIGLAVTKNESALLLKDADEKIRAGLAVAKEGPMLALSGADGKFRAVLGATKATTPYGKVVSYPESSLTLFGPDGSLLWQAPP